MNLALQAMIVINREDLVKFVLDYARINTFLVFVKPDDLLWALRLTESDDLEEGAADYSLIRELIYGQAIIMPQTEIEN